jgi:hypothetical protein
MRLGKVYIPTHYVVDLDNESMANEAKECMYEDLMNAVKYNELANWIEITEDSSLSEKDIPEFLKDSEGIEYEAVDMIAGGYEWTCPHCEALNAEIGITEMVKCPHCHRQFHIGDYYHAYGD